MECGCLKDKVVNLVKLILGEIGKRKKLVGVVFIILVAVGLVGGKKFWHYAESSEFCGSCHEMDVHYDSFMSSKHHNEHVHSCHTCHIGPGLKGFLHAKLSDGAHDSFEHMRKTYLTSASSALFIEIAEDSVPIVNGNCVRCHTNNEEFTKDKTHLECISQSKRKGEDGSLEDFFCTDCHIGVVHPSWSADVYKVYAEKKIPPFGIFSENDCYACHRHATPEVVKEWTNSPHSKSGVSCLECHGDDHGKIVEREGRVLPSKCGECHVTMYNDFAQSNHYKGRVVAEIAGVAVSTKDAAMREDCRKCHMLGLNKSWDTGPGGSCEGCHPKHLFSRLNASEAKVCENCHIGGPVHAQLDMSDKSMHGKLFGRWEEEGNVKLRCQSCHSDPYSHHNFNRNVGLLSD